MSRHATPRPRNRLALAAAALAVAVTALAGGAVAVGAATTIPSKADGIAALDAARANLDVASAALAAPDPTVTVTETATATVTATPAAPTPTPTPSGTIGTPTPTTPPAGALPTIPFAPPVLASPIVLDATKTVNTGFKLDPARDYIIRLPANATYRNTSGLSIAGGHNVVVIGGVIDVGNGNAGTRRCGYFKDITGTLHVEGLRCGSSTGTLTEGLNISAPKAVIQIANVHISSVTEGSRATNHADLLQTWNGPRTLRVFGFKGQSNYQAMFLNARDTNPLAEPIEGTWTMDRVAVEVVNNGGYTLWLVSPPGSIAVGSQVHAWGGNGLWKPPMWAGVKTYLPAEDFVPTAGLAYVSPGYR